MGTIRALEKSYNRADAKGFLLYVTEDVVGYDPSLTVPLEGRQAVGAWFEKGHSVFPDLKMEPIRTTAVGDVVAVEYIETGTHKGAFPGPGGRPMLPTNKSFRHQMCVVYRLEKGKVAEFRLYWDILGVMAQLGLGG